MAIPGELAMVGGESEELDELAATTGTCSITTTDVHGESKGAFRFNPSAGNLGYGEIQGRGTAGDLLALSIVDPHIGFYLKIKTLPAAAPPKVGMLLRLMNTATFICSLRISPSGDLYLMNAELGSVDTGFDLSVDTWYWIGLRANILENDIEVRVGDSLFERTGFPLGNLAVNKFYIGHSYNTDPYDTAVDFVFDSVIVDTSWHAKTDIVRLLPNANGTYVTWNQTPGTGSLYDKVDEVPDDADTTYVSNPAAYAPVTFNVEAASARSISDDIRAVIPYAKARKVSLPETVQLRIRSGGTDYDGGDNSLGSSYAGIQLVYKVDPTDSNAWTTGKVDALEVGLDWMGGIQVADLLRCTQAMVCVAHLPSPPAGASVHIKGGAIRGGALVA